jgi:glycolate dehydrogenase FAD-binding subunit
LPTVSEPASLEEAERELERAAAEGLRVGIGHGGDVTISTRRLNRVIEHSAGDLTAIVEAGIRLSELDAKLAKHGQMLALDPPGDPTVGACLAADLSGPRRHHFGTARDLVIGVTVVLAYGTRASSGGRVVKNVAGYDLGKLFCGSRGTLGLIARVGLRLHPRPKASRTLVVPVADAERAQQLAQTVLRSQLAPVAVDLLWPGRLALLFEGGRRAVDAQLDDARALLGGHEDDSVWAEIGEAQLASRGRVTFAPGRLAPVLASTDRAVVRVAAGVAHVAEPQRDPRDDAVRALAERVRREFDPGGVLA